MKRIISVLLSLSMIFALCVFVSGEDPKTAVVTSQNSIRFEDLDSLVKASNLNVLALAENIASLDELDYKMLEDDLRDKLNSTAELQWGFETMPQTSLVENVLMGMQIKQLDSGYDQIREQFDNLRDGTMKADNDKVKASLETLQNQAVMGAESLFISYKTMEVQRTALVRQIAALERTLDTLEIRKNAGQVSELNILEMKSGIAAAESGLATLDNGLELMKLQLKGLLGIDLDAKISLAGLSDPDGKAIASMSLEEDLKKAKSVSTELVSAADTLADAKETYEDAKDEYGVYSEKNEWNAAKHTYKAAQYQYDASVQSYELKFRTLYLNTKDLAQAYEYQKSLKELKEKTLQVAQIKYSYGQISRYALLDAQDSYDSYLNDLENAKLKLIDSYTKYQHAVNDGILN